MEPLTYHRALLLTEKVGDDIVYIGGGEPTIHPRFLEYLADASDVLSVCFVTNGSRLKVMQQVEMNIERGYYLHTVYPELSNDEYHKYCSVRNQQRYYDTFERIYKMFKRNKWGIRNGLGGVTASGRGANVSDEYYCPCSDVFITPNGDVYGCGCRARVLGNVLHDSMCDILEAICAFRDEHEDYCELDA